MGTVGLSLEEFEETKQGTRGPMTYLPTRGISSAKLKTLPEFDDPRFDVPEEEREFAAANPDAYAAGRVFWDFLTLGRRTLAPSTEELEESFTELNRHIPFLKYVDPREKEKFLGLPQQEQSRAILWDTVESLLIMLPKAIPFFFKGVAKTLAPAAAAVRVLKPTYKFAPIEDLILKGVRPFIKEEAAVHILKGKGFKKAEAVAAIDDSLVPFYRENVLLAKVGEVRKPSKAFAKATDWSSGVPRLRKDIQELLETDKLRRAHFRREWKRAFSKVAGKEYKPGLAAKAFDAQVGKSLGQESVGKITLNNAPDIFVANYARDLIRGSKTIRGVLREGVYDKIVFDSFNPVRVAMGAMEKPYGLYKNVYRTVGTALERRNVYVNDKIFTFLQMLKQRGLGTWTTKKTGELVPKLNFGAKEAKIAYEAGLQIDSLMEFGRRTPQLIEKMRSQAKAIVEGLPEVPRKILKTKHDLYESLYAEHVLEKIPQLFEGAGLTAAGQRGVERLQAGIAPLLGKLFSKVARVAKEGRTEMVRYSYENKALAIKRLLHEVRGTLKHPWVKKEGMHPWFVAEGKELAKVLERLDHSLDKGFVGYLENYSARVSASGARMKKSWDTALLGQKHAFYTKVRKDISPHNLVDDLGSEIEGRIRAGANELFLYPKIDKAVSLVKELPRRPKEYVDHYISRILGRQAATDTKVASFLNSTIGWIGGRSYWTEQKVTALARRLNDLALMAGLGFKPFAAMRDLFQPLVTVPADLGGLKGFHHLLQGYKRSITDPSFRKYIRDIGAIQEFAPELYLRQGVFPFGKGVRWDQTRDVALWMYGHTDRFSRYVTGGAAIHKWEGAIRKAGLERVLTKEGQIAFSRKLGLQNRYPWVREEIEEAIRFGNLDEAKALWINDVTADCQFLYRVSESPIVSQKYGALGRTGFLFQSWWMNYGTLLEKWMRTGDAGAKANKMFTWMTSSAIAATLMEGMWGPETALRTTFLGPFPTTFDKTLIPAAWTPIYEVLHGVAWGIPTRLWEGEPGKLEKHARSLIKSSAMFFPGGLQIKQMARAVAKEGIEGLPASIIRYQRARNWEPMPVRVAKGIERMID